jgi:hypothetical protein
MNGIPMQTMPQNFQDAVLVTRRLGINFLWIDCLCIIQDDPQDWNAEAATMNQVYKGAYLTLVATSAICALDGFLKRRTSTYPPVKIPYINLISGEASGSFYLLPRYSHWAENDFDKYIEATKWNSRGWTFQERILSRRLLHFAEGGLYYECRENELSEDNKPLFSAVSRTPWLRPDGVGLQKEMSATISSEDRLYRMWYILMEHFAERDISFSDDKLPAASGIAHGMAGFIDDEYFAGLWRKDLSRGLLWTTRDDDSRTTQLPRYRAPSWSWASLDGGITWAVSLFCDIGSPKHIPCFELLDISVIVVGADPMGGISSGRLTLSGKLRAISAVKRNNSGLELGCHDILHAGTVVGEGRLDLSSMSLTESGLFALLIHRYLCYTADGSYFAPVGLLLRSVSETGHYQRVGMFNFLARGRRVPVGLDFFNDCEAQTVTIL